MSSTEISKPKKTVRFAAWREYPLEIKIMDLASLAWLAVGILEMIFYLIGTELNERVFPIVFLPFFMFVVTISLRLRLLDKPDTLRNTFIVWAVIFILMVITVILILILYPPFSV
ncbi:MAG: hypothetical protein KAX09_09355 [Candidatus Heimdallarchaeota archaeon]|nr:hypothetical protein [Candidatus Heimdallarchaeota archaeon]MCK4291176.1 hypothetical protein [Candidatus Heimdallarchaeota archaeon]